MFDMWTLGRQGTGYLKKRIFEGSWPVPFDCYLLKFPAGSYIPPHKDPVEDNEKHYRLNILLQSPDDGGKFNCGDCIFRLGRVVLFRPDINEHSVDPIIGRDRLVLSLGWKVRS